MKILHCIPILDRGGGAERQLSYLATGMVQRGHEVHVAYAQGGALVAPLADAGVALHDVGGRGNYDPRIALKLAKLMRALRPDVVQTSLPQMDVLGGAAAIVTGTRWILRESSAAPSYPRGWKSGLRRLLGRRADAVVANSAEGAAYWQTRHIIPNGVALGDVRPAPGNEILFAGRLTEGKNVHTLLDALALLDVDAVICGDGPLREELQRQAGPRVTFTGVIDDLRERMQRASVVVSLSRFEGCSNVVMEAMACGAPLVVSDIAAHRALLGDAALFVDPDDAPAAAGAIESVLLDRDAARDRANAARARAAQWTIDAMVTTYENVYRA
jgi:glycosyltransferase involved in cell wall biosynthesis